MKKVIEASEAIALGTKLCRPGVVPMYPITPQTHIVERLADYIFDGELDSEIIHAESEHSAISAALGAQATGARTFTATASQGLALMHEMLFVVSGMRLPVVMAVANRALSAPISIWNDHQDSISARDSGWIQFYVESAQEALDTVIMAFKIAENEKVRLPVMVCLDGFTLSHVWEEVDIPEQGKVDKFLPKYNPKYYLDPKKPITMGPIAYPNSFMEMKKMQQDSMISAIDAVKKVSKEFNAVFGRSYGDGMIENYKMADAEYAVICAGTICGTSRVVVDEMQEKGKKVGLIKLKSFRPFPKKELITACKKLKGIAVLDRNISVGQEGGIYTELREVLAEQNIIVNGFIAGLGGRDVKPDHIIKALNSLNKKRETEWLM